MSLTCRLTSGRGIAGVGVWIALIALVFLPIARVRAGTPASQPSGGDKNSLESLVKNLGNPDPRVREAGRVGLLRLHREDLADFKRATAKSRPLLPAQTAALRIIVRQIYLAEDVYRAENSGFLGILMDRPLNPNADFVPANDTTEFGIVVNERVPGFCAGRWLQDGDVILGTARPFTPFRRSDDLSGTIGPQPGVNIGLLVLRQGELVIVILKPDHKPFGIGTAEQIPPFQAEREKRFAAYWDKEFEPILADKIPG